MTHPAPIPRPADPSWVASCDNRQGIDRLYDSPDGLEAIDLHEVILHRDGPRLVLRFDLPRFADHPPRRWHPEANTVQAEVSFWGAEGVRMDGWGTVLRGTLLVEHGEDGSLMRFQGSGTRLTARFRTARIDRFAAYLAEPPPSRV